MNRRINETDTMGRRMIHLNLTDEDVRRLTDKAGSVGLSVSQLIENFISDLVDGTYSNGSDERMYANQWFNRCWFSSPFNGEDSFLKYSLMNGDIYEVLAVWDNIRATKASLVAAGKAEDPDSMEEIAEIKADLAYEEDVMKVLYSEFLQSCENRDDKDFNQQMKEIEAWGRENWLLQNGDE